MKFLSELVKKYVLMSITFILVTAENIYNKYGEIWVRVYAICLGGFIGILIILLFWYFHKFVLVLLLVILFGFILKIALMVKPLLPKILDETKNEMKKFMENSNES